MQVIKLINEETDFEIELKVKDCWDDVYLNEYLKLVNLYASKEKIDELVFLKDLLMIITDATEDEIMQVPVEELNKIIPIAEVFSTMVTSFDEEFIIIDETLYVPKKQMSFNMEEMTYYKAVQGNNNVTETFLSLLVLLLRPGYKKEKDGKVKYIQNRFAVDDIEQRKEIFKTKLKSSIAVPLINFFMNGTKK